VKGGWEELVMRAGIRRPRISEFPDLNSKLQQPHTQTQKRSSDWPVQTTMFAMISTIRQLPQPRFKSRFFVLSSVSPYHPSKGGLDDEDPVVAQEIMNDPYRCYVFETGKPCWRTLEQYSNSNAEGLYGYLRWMLTSEKACKSIDDDHVVRRALVGWNDQAGDEATVPPSDEVPPISTGKEAQTFLYKLCKIPKEVPARFKDTKDVSMWITGHDIIGLFHMLPISWNASAPRK
jgi:hypothetical protein